MRSSTDAQRSIPVKNFARRKVILLAFCGVVLASMILVVIMNIDRSDHQQASESPPLDMSDIDGPAPLKPGEQSAGIESTNIQPHAMGATRSWIQIIEPDGTTSKQYRFESLDPMPDGWSKMTKPQIEAKMGSDRIVRLEGDEALFYTPAKKPEAGTLSGNVVIRTYEYDPGSGDFDIATAPLLLEIRTQQAVFDNTRGEIRCDGKLTLETPNALLDGSGFRMLLNEVAQRAEWLRMEQATVRISNQTQDAPDDDRPPKASATPKEAGIADKATTHPSSAAAKKKPAGPLFYRLTFQDNVQIAEGTDGDGWIGEGDELTIVFSTHGKSLSRSLTQNPIDRPTAEFVAAPTPSLLASLALANVTQSPEALFTPRSDDIVITCDGGLTMRPLETGIDEPSSTDDARFELIGSPMRLRNPTERVLITGKALEYRMTEQKFKIISDDQYKLNINSPEMLATADHLWIDRIKNAGALEGTGWMIVRDEQLQANQAADSKEQLDRGIRIDWRDKVDLKFATAPLRDGEPKSSDANMKLRGASFLGDVKVNNPDLNMRADVMDVAIPESKSDETHASIESIIAKGAVSAKSLGDGGSIDCGQLRIGFAPHQDGRTVPFEMIATEHVAANDLADQRVWCDLLQVQFDTSVPSSGAASGTDDRVKVKLLTATDHVQALLKNGARAFADKLEADPAAETITLTATDLIVISGESLIHRGTRLEFHQKSNLAQWPGPGEFVQFATPIVAPGIEPIAKPAVDTIIAAQNPRQMIAQWTDSMTYDSAFDNGAGQITLRGRVHAESDSSPLQHNTLDAQELTLQFARLVAKASPGAEATASLSDDSKRQLKLMIATGAEGEFAKIESLTWTAVDHSDAPRIFYIAGAYIEYDDVSFEALVKGKGEMLVSDPPAPAGTAPKTGAATDAPPAPSPAPVAFSAKGDTSFRWSEQLAMKRAAENTFNVQMAGAIQVNHLAPDDSMTKVTCTQLDAHIERSAATQKRGDAMDFGGAMQVKSLHGSGDVYIDSPTRDIDCAEFDYDNVAGIVNLIGGPDDGTVAVTTPGDATPLRARRVVWNTKTNKITATDISGAPSR